jgi:hypothetical protein
MSRRLFVAFTLLLGTLAPCTAVRALAQETPDADPATMSIIAATPAILRALPATDANGQFGAPQVPSHGLGGRALMGSLYASTAVLQALDIHSTLKGLDRGATEANPMMSGLAARKGAFVATKIGVSAATILAARQMAKKNKLAAALTLVGINSLYAVVVSHNYKVVRSLR